MAAARSGIPAIPDDRATADGRRLRRDRNRDAVVRALLVALQRGQPRPVHGGDRRPFGRVGAIAVPLLRRRRRPLRRPPSPSSRTTCGTCCPCTPPPNSRSPSASPRWCASAASCSRPSSPSPRCRVCAHRSNWSWPIASPRARAFLRAARSPRCSPPSSRPCRRPSAGSRLAAADVVHVVRGVAPAARRPTAVARQGSQRDVRRRSPPCSTRSPPFHRKSTDEVPAHPRRSIRRPARLPVRAALPHHRRRRGWRAARALPRRRPGRRGARAADARRTELVVPLPHDDPRARRRGPSRASRPTSSASAAPTSPPSSPTTPTRRHVAWMHEALFDTARPARHHVLRPGLGRPRRACAWWPPQPDRFARVVVGNTGPPTGDATPTDAFLAWQKFSRESPSFPIGGIVNGGCATDLPPEVIAAYDAPFPDDTYKAGARIFPSLVPTGADDPGPRRPGGRMAGAVRRSPGRGCARSATRTRSPQAARRRSCARCPAARASRTSPSKAAATSCRRTRAPSWRRSSPTSSPPPDGLPCQGAEVSVSPVPSGVAMVSLVPSMS